MNFSNFIAVTSALFVWSATAEAAVINYGKWLCTECNPQDPVDLSTQPFIASTVNGGAHIFSWKAGDFVTICNGSMCGDWEFAFFSRAAWKFKLGSGKADTGKGYKNAAPFSDAGCHPNWVGYTPMTYTVTGYYYRYDYYSDGNFIGSSGLYFQPTGTIPSGSSVFNYRPFCA